MYPFFMISEYLLIIPNFEELKHDLSFLMLISHSLNELLIEFS